MCGKSYMVLHSDLQVGGVVLGTSQAFQSPETLNNEGKHMNNTKQSGIDATNMGGKTNAAKGLPWWCVLLLVAPLV
jgi:hypothetical protein